LGGASGKIFVKIRANFLVRNKFRFDAVDASGHTSARAQVMFEGIFSSVGYIKAGKLRALGRHVGDTSRGASGYSRRE
jgi:hypothetical protein